MCELPLRPHHESKAESSPYQPLRLSDKKKSHPPWQSTATCSATPPFSLKYNLCFIKYNLYLYKFKFNFIKHKLYFKNTHG